MFYSELQFLIWFFETEEYLLWFDTPEQKTTESQKQKMLRKNYCKSSPPKGQFLRNSFPPSPQQNGGGWGRGHYANALSMKHTFTHYSVKSFSKMNFSEIKNTPPFLVFFTTIQYKYHSFISLVWKRLAFFMAFYVGLYKEKYLKRNQENVCMKEK